MMPREKLRGERSVIDLASAEYPELLRGARNPPKKLYLIGSREALAPGLAVIGARKATPYGRSCARRFARLASEKGVNIISGGARGCDSEAHRAAIEAGGTTVAFLGGGCDRLYPPEHWQLFQRIVDQGGAVASEHAWDYEPRGYAFRERNRLIAGLAEAVLIVEAGLPSGTFSTADEALDAGKEVLVVPGSITSSSSRGSNRLLAQGAVPVVDDDGFEDALFRICGVLKRPRESTTRLDEETSNPILMAIMAQPIDDEALLVIAENAPAGADARSWLSETLAEAEMRGLIARQPDGKWCSVVR